MLAPAAPDPAVLLLGADAGLQRGVQRRDLRRVGALLDDGFELICSTGERTSRAAWLAALRNPRRSQQMQRHGAAAVRLCGATGIVTGLLDERVDLDGETRHRRELVTDTWVWAADGWRLLARHASVVDEAW